MPMHTRQADAGELYPIGPIRGCLTTPPRGVLLARPRATSRPFFEAKSSVRPILVGDPGIPIGITAPRPPASPRRPTTLIASPEELYATGRGEKGFASPWPAHG